MSFLLPEEDSTVIEIKVSDLTRIPKVGKYIAIGQKSDAALEKMSDHPFLKSYIEKSKCKCRTSAPTSADIIFDAVMKLVEDAKDYKNDATAAGIVSYNEIARQLCRNDRLYEYMLASEKKLKKEFGSLDKVDLYMKVMCIFKEIEEDLKELEQLRSLIRSIKEFALQNDKGDDKTE